ncbi:response regulator transcription factor [Metapseudomonas otitidis]|uniref:response regulator transcription factor n=1 Tax=Metapseudomonas otitidis TaxID=319939 RepID=UPI0013F5DF1F|nr:response regulator [Pseudomonas otitidis]
MVAPVRILVVDDDAEVRELLQDYLGGHAYQVETACDSGSMRAALAAGLPDLVLLDVGLPGEDGLSLARYLREHHDLPVIMVSGAGSAVDRTIGLEVGADDYVAKPFDPRELLARIKTVLRRYQRAPALGVLLCTWGSPAMGVAHLGLALLVSLMVAWGVMRDRARSSGRVLRLERAPRDGVRHAA